MKYTPFGGSIDLRSFADCKMGVFEIADSGPGIPEEERGKIFQPFYQGEAPLNGIIKGTGLGLSIAKEYVLEQGGRISVKNSRSGGACFQVAFPLAKRGTEGMKIIKKAGIPAVSIWLLVVLSGCLPGTYYGGKNCFGDKWEAVVEKDAPAETLFSRFYYLKQLQQEERANEYEKVLIRLKHNPDLFWHLEALYLARLDRPPAKGNRPSVSIERGDWEAEV